jgi:hypothetical protein
MDFFSNFACCGKRGTNQDLIRMSAQNEFATVDPNKVARLFIEFEGRLSDLKIVPVHEFIREAKLLASYDGTMTTRQLSLLYQKYEVTFTKLITFYAQEFFFKN